MTPQEMRDRVASARVARLATVGDGMPHLVPITFAFTDDLLWTAVDHKPKRTLDLRRLRNIAQQPRVSVLIDHYEEDWEALWWIRLDGMGRVLSDAAERRGPLDRLRDKYDQYRGNPPQGPVIEVRIHAWRSWSARS